MTATNASVISFVNRGDYKQFHKSVNQRLTSYGSNTSSSISSSETVEMTSPCKRFCCPDARMSDVRRTFCLLVTFDLLLSIILWIIYCQIVNDKTIWSQCLHEIRHYSFESSLFDTMLLALLRFVVLLLMYALLRLNHWWPVAITTLATCIFLMVKVFLFKFTDPSGGNGSSFTYILLIASFVISWGETWFMDFKVISTERDLNTFKLNLPVIFKSEKTPLLHNKHMIEDMNNYYTPVDSPSVSDDEGAPITSSRRHERRRKYHSAASSFEASFHGNFMQSTYAIESYKQQAEDAWEKLWKLLEDREKWQLSKGKVSDNLCVFTQKLDTGGKVHMLQATLDIPALALFEEFVYHHNRMPSWNPSITECQTLLKVNDNTDVVYHVTADAAGGLVSSRDFVSLRHWGRRGGFYISVACSTIHQDKPPNNKYIRGENGPGGYVIKEVEGNPQCSSFYWIVDCNLKGWIPQNIVDQSLSGVMFDFVKYIRQHFASVNNL